MPVRLGLHKVNKEYFNPILSIFQCPHNVGIIGGRPSQALYFVGSQKQDLLLLDPHQVTDSLPANNEDALRYGHLSYHTNLIRKINLSKIDTTLAFGFYLRDYEAYRDFQGFLQQNKIVHRDNWLFSHFEAKPKLFDIDMPDDARRSSTAPTRVVIKP